MGDGVEYPAAPLLIGLEYREDVSERWIGDYPGGAQCVAAMDEHVTKAHLRGHDSHTGLSACGAAETSDQFRHRLVAQLSGDSLNSTIWPEAVAADLPEHRQLRRLCPPHEVTKYVADTPASAPRRDIPLIRR
jgi:hypothetical protein